MDEVEHGLDRRRFSRAVSSDKAGDPSRLDAERRVAQFKCRIPFDKMPHFNNTHMRLQMFDLYEYCNTQLQEIHQPIITGFYFFCCFSLRRRVNTTVVSTCLGAAGQINLSVFDLLTHPNEETGNPPGQVRGGTAK